MEKPAMSPEVDAKMRMGETVETASDVAVADTMEMIAYHLLSVSRSLDMASVDEFARLLNEGDRIFVMGAGRSGLVARSRSPCVSCTLGTRSTLWAKLSRRP
jgi:DNA-binding MurR/RpiR family transcriptional regulator